MVFGTCLVQALEKQVICFHSQSGVVTYFCSQSIVAFHCCYLALVVAVGWRAAGSSFCGGAVHLPELYMSVSQEDVSSDLNFISAPQVVSFELPHPPSWE